MVHESIFSEGTGLRLIVSWSWTRADRHLAARQSSMTKKRQQASRLGHDPQGQFVRHFLLRIQVESNRRRIRQVLPQFAAALELKVARHAVVGWKAFGPRLESLEPDGDLCTKH